MRGEPRQELRHGQDVVYELVRVHQESVEGGGVRADFVPYEPPNPVAGNEGIVARPNVDYATEIVEMQRAEDAYRANIRTIIAEDEMTGSLIDEMG
ncbi:MAG: flagellar basal body rod C-terminal domain-containing protein [Alphaproteobacteria bacterium]